MQDTRLQQDEVKLTIDGMTCSNCAMSITKYLQKKGMEDILVDFSTAEARFKTSNPEEIPAIKNGIAALGYTVTGQFETPKKPGFLTLTNKFYISLVFTLPLLLHMLLPFSFLHNPYLQLAFCLPVFAIGMYHFGRSAWGSIKVGLLNMDVLITLGSAAAFFYSLTGTIMELGPDFLFYETSATIITLVLLGNLIEHRSVQQTTTAIEELGKLQASKAKLLITDDNGIETTHEINADEVKRDQILLVNTGDKIPADGIIVWGECSLDESMVTGESKPVEKMPGDWVIGGTIVGKGSIKMSVEAIGESTYLSNIIEMVKGAQRDKPEIQRLADQISAYFVPIIMVISIGTFLVSYFVAEIPIQKALLSSVAVLVIACPCAMGLATPTAIMVGIGKITKNGILIKGGKTLEELATIQQIVFDKTGTLTTGKFKIDKINAHKENPEKIKSILLSMEKHSSHPIAVSIVRELKGASEILLKKVQEQKGIGIKAEGEDGSLFELGSYQMVRQFTTDNQHDLYLLQNGVLIATIDIRDEIKPEAKDTITYLKEQGVRAILLSGDNYRKCSLVAKELGIETFYFGKKPDEKLTIIGQLTRNMPTAMVGDGINDAPALAKATIGISLSNASDAAIDSSQVILLNGNLSHLKGALSFSKKTLTTIKQNLFWAFSYNIIAIPIAAVGLLNPMIAALSMAFSDIMVVGNSLRLKTKKI